MFATPSMNKRILVSAFSLTLLLIVVKPEVTAGMTLLMRIGFWVSHIGAGVFAGYAVVYLTQYLTRFGGMTKGSLILTILMTGVVGALMATPLFCILEHLFPQSTDDHVVSFSTLPRWLSIYLQELTEAGPVFVAVWFCLHLPFLFAKPSVIDALEDESEAEEGMDDEERQERFLRAERLDAFKANLPTQLGDDVVSMSSDLHYIKVYTTQGDTMILGSLKHVASLFEEEGLLVHRSHWVRKQHVQRLYTKEGASFCQMSNGMSVPVSRNRKKEAKAAFSSLSVTNALSKPDGGNIIEIDTKRSVN